MKLAALALFLGPVTAAPQGSRGLRRPHLTLAQDASAGFAKAPVSYGSPLCPCIGLDNVPGATDISVNGTTTSYPADTGARCSAWSDGVDPLCSGDSPPSYCAEKWCYVDPCNCNIPDLPKKSKFLPEAAFKGMLIYYSYATCDGTDYWTADVNDKACVNHKTKDACSERGGMDCEWMDGKCLPFELSGVCKGHEPKEETWGRKSCPCVGVEGVPGHLKVKVSSQENAATVEYPADSGSVCKAWDDGLSPKCQEGSASPWCKQTWCYVDPCNCDLGGGKHPAKAKLLEDAIFQGKPAYYSYATCGSEDLWAKGEDATSCRNQMDEEACKQIDDCAWSAGECIGWELAGLCDMFNDQITEKEPTLGEVPPVTKAPAQKQSAESAVKGSASSLRPLALSVGLLVSVLL